MALIKCPECGKEVSDKAEVCIHCGYPLKPKQEAEEPNPGSEKEKEGKKSKAGSTALVVIVMLLLCVAGYIMMNRLAYGG